MLYVCRFRLYDGLLLQWKSDVLFSRKNSKGQNGICAISLDHTGLAVSYARRDSTGCLCIEFCQFFPDVTEIDLQEILSKLVQQHQLKRVPCYWVLSADYYQLLQIDALSVPASELLNAVGWRVKDLLDFPLTETVIDVFDSPARGAGQQKQGLYVTAAKRNALQNVAQAIEKSGLCLQVIDIAELALRNIATLFTEEHLGLAVLALMPQRSELVISRQGNLYFSRHISLDITALSASEPAADEIDRLLQGIVLEVQRSYDYYISQLRQNTPHQLIIAPVFDLSAQHVARLAQLLDAKVELLNADDLLSSKQPLSQQQQCLLALGGILRDEEKRREVTS